MQGLKEREAARDRRRTADVKAAKKFLKEILGEHHGFWAGRAGWTHRGWEARILDWAAWEAHQA